MPTFKLTALASFTDAETGKWVHRYNTVVTESVERALNIVNLGLGELVEASHGKSGTRVMIQQNLLYKIGGIETANRHLARAFADYNICFVFSKADMAQLMELAKTCDVIIDDGKRTFDTDVLLLANYESAPTIINRVRAKKVYQQIHADWESLTAIGGWQYFKWVPHPKVDKILTVSETAQRGLKNKFGYDSIVVPNVLTPPQDQRKVFLVLSRASAEKGINRVLELHDKFKAANKDFIFLMASTIENGGAKLEQEIKSRERIVLVEPTVYATSLFRCADFLVQLSATESYCYSVREALQRQVPVICSDIPECAKLIKNGKNGYILNDDMSNLDIDAIFNKKLKFEPYTEEIDPNWYKALEGEL